MFGNHLFTFQKKFLLYCHLILLAYSDVYISSMMKTLCLLLMVVAVALAVPRDDHKHCCHCAAGLDMANTQVEEHGGRMVTVHVSPTLGSCSVGHGNFM